MNKEVNFEIAKLLKEKGFKGAKSPLWYYKDGTLHETPTEGYKGLKCWNTWDATQGVRWDAPTITDVVMWLYEKHTIWIGVELTDNTREFYFQHTIWTSKDRDFHDEDMIDQAKSICKWKEWQYNSPAGAYEAAITYTLEHLT